jgi:hypothetical protein
MLSVSDYTEGMMERIDDVLEDRLQALRGIKKEKLRVAKVSNPKVKEKSFHVEEPVWKTILTLGSKDRKFGKWPPSWEGPFRIIGVMPENSCFVETLEGKKVEKALNGKYLKKYFPNV